jgi:hypothetical protein
VTDTVLCGIAKALAGLRSDDDARTAATAVVRITL